MTSSNIYSNSYYISGTNYQISGTSSYGFLIKNNSGNLVFTLNNTEGNFRNDLKVDNDLEVMNDVTITNDLLVANGSITNYESPTTLIPSDPFVYWSSTGNFQGSVINGGTYALSGFTYSFNFYRVGRLINLDFVIKKTTPTTYSTPFYGWLLKFNNSRFMPSSLSISGGVGGYTGQFMPVSIQCFRDDGTTNNPPTPNPGEFFFKIGTFENINNGLVSGRGADFRALTPINNLYFRGTISYLGQSNPANNPPVIYTPPVDL